MSTEALVKRKRGRPRINIPFFEDPDAERVRVKKCIAEGRDPYPPFKHEPCEADLELREEIIPGVPFKLVLAMYGTDDDGVPCISPETLRRWEEAAQNRKNASQAGVEATPRFNKAACIIAEEEDYIREKRREGVKKSDVINWIKANRIRAGKSVASRTEMYKQLGLSRVW